MRNKDSSRVALTVTPAGKMNLGAAAEPQGRGARVHERLSRAEAASDRLSEPVRSQQVQKLWLGARDASSSLALPLSFRAGSVICAEWEPQNLEIISWT